MTHWMIIDIVLGVLLALLIGSLVGYRAGVNDGSRRFAQIMDELDVDKEILKKVWAKFSKNEGSAQ